MTHHSLLCDNTGIRIDIQGKFYSVYFFAEIICNLLLGFNMIKITTRCGKIIYYSTIEELKRHTKVMRYKILSQEIVSDDVLDFSEQNKQLPWTPFWTKRSEY